VLSYSVENLCLREKRGFLWYLHNFLSKRGFTQAFYEMKWIAFSDIKQILISLEELVNDLGGKIWRWVSHASLELLQNICFALVMGVKFNTFFKRQNLSQVSFCNNNLLTQPTLPSIFSSLSLGALRLANPFQLCFLFIVSLPKSALIISKGSD